MPNGTKKQKKTDAKQADIREFFGKKKRLRQGQRWNTFFLILKTACPMERRSRRKLRR
jgi:hypothetical protein